jgi:hypothetical protein
MQRSKLRQFLLVSDGYFTISFHHLFPVLITALLLLFSGKSYGQSGAQSQAEAYVKVITERAGKIVAQLNISNPEKAEKLRDIIRDQYSNLNDIYALRDSNLKAIKIQYKDDKALRDTAVAAESRRVEISLAKLHPEYISKMSRLLNAGQIEQVKNGMTYNVLPITYKAYQEQILTLNEVQKKQILIWLTEAREHAIDAESSDKKHAWFGKYKGRINNYLSAAGYDLRKEGEEWQKRIKSQASQAN